MHNDLTHLGLSSMVATSHMWLLTLAMSQSELKYANGAKYITNVRVTMKKKECKLSQ